MPLQIKIYTVCCFVRMKDDHVTVFSYNFLVFN